MNKTESPANILKNHDPQQHITKPTRNGRKLIDHIVSNLSNIFTENVLPCDKISDHDGPYVIADIKRHKLQPRYKIILTENNFNVGILLFNLMQSVDSPEEKLDIFEHILVSCLNEHARPEER